MRSINILSSVAVMLLFVSPVFGGAINEIQLPEDITISEGEYEFHPGDDLSHLNGCGCGVVYRPFVYMERAPSPYYQVITVSCENEIVLPINFEISYRELLGSHYEKFDFMGYHFDFSEFVRPDKLSLYGEHFTFNKCILEDAYYSDISIVAIDGIYVFRSWEYINWYWYDDEGERSPKLVTHHQVIFIKKDKIDEEVVPTEDEIDEDEKKTVDCNKPQFTVYPNPFVNTITIESSEKSTVCVYNASGQELDMINVDGVVTFDFINKPNGIYYVSNGYNSKKIIKME